MATLIEHWRIVWDAAAGTGPDSRLWSLVLLLLIVVLLIVVSCIRYAVNDKDRWDE